MPHDDGKKHLVRNLSMGLNSFPLTDYRWKIETKPLKTEKDIPRSLKLPCNRKSHDGAGPYYTLDRTGDKKVWCRKICNEHRQVVAATIKVDPTWHIEILGLKLRIERMVGY